MMWPPSVLWMRFGRGNRRVRLLVPLFLVWPSFALLALAFFPLVLILAVLLWPVGWSRPLLVAGPLFFRLFCSLRGLSVDVKGKHGQVFVTVR